MKLFNLMQLAFDNFDGAINDYLNKVFANIGVQYGENQLFKVILSAFKGITQNILLYIEDAFTEQNVETAIRKKSIYSLAKISGYEAFYGSAATGIIIASMISNTNLSSDVRKIYIDNYTNIINNTTGINYVLYLQADRYVFDVAKPLSNYEFRIIQGTYNTLIHTGTGESMYTIHLSIHGMFDKSFVKVYVDNVEWQAVSNLYDMSENGEEYILEIGYENELDITFGNGIYGKIPYQGANIKVSYILHDGASGNISNISNTKFEFNSPGHDYNGNPINLNNYIALKLDNYVSGGTNSDSINTVRSMIGFNSRSNVLASVDNYRLFLKHFSFIGNFNIWVENNSNILCINAINSKINDIKDISEYENLTENDLLLTDIQKSHILTILKNSNNTFAGISIKFIDPIIYKYAIICYVKVTDPYYKEIVEINIKNSILKYFSSKIFNVSFIAKSDIIKYILDTVDNIKSLNIEIISDKNEEAYKNSYYYKYNTVALNGKIEFKMEKYSYESNMLLGLDEMNNIVLDNKIYLPLLQNGVKYYPNKHNQFDNDVCITLKPVNIIFV